jgi:hypothetical protein
MANFQQWGVRGWGRGGGGNGRKLAPLITFIGGGRERGRGRAGRGENEFVLVLNAACMHVVFTLSLFLISPFWCRGLFRYKKACGKPYSVCMTNVVEIFYKYIVEVRKK